MEDINLSAVSKLADQILVLRERRDEIEAKLAEVNKERISLEMKMASYLEALGTNSQVFHGFKFVRAERTAVSNPQMAEDVEAFHKWLEERGEARTFLTVNSQTLSSQYSKWIAELRDTLPEDAEIVIPGLPEPRITPYLQVKKA